MPVIVVGADTELGAAIVPALRPASGEIRVFASDADAVAGYRPFAKVAVGDLSDGTHVGGAAIGAFCAILLAAAAHDDRERHFAGDAGDLFAQWADGLADAGIRRVIVVGDDNEIPTPAHVDRIGAECVFVATAGRPSADIVADVLAAEAAERI